MMHGDTSSAPAKFTRRIDIDEKVRPRMRSVCPRMLACNHRYIMMTAISVNFMIFALSLIIMACHYYGYSYCNVLPSISQSNYVVISNPHQWLGSRYSPAIASPVLPVTGRSAEAHLRGHRDRPGARGARWWQWSRSARGPEGLFVS